ncbi:hypothetical protein HIM_11864 [Hirsutella minnesotensis 3608]|uniref:Reverse transcriptase domain-containing protein n=1 Tax=Hirsutella minnesotensis 3608 TaxID=1043627 RepID=A0A0F8A0Q0_9HYPO|nr:hypothetical protein HIM_11864 [Hirsutella minnesotensis 3608]
MEEPYEDLSLTTRQRQNREVNLRWEDIAQQMRDQLKQVQQQLEATIVGSAVTPPSTFAEVARSSPSPQRNTLRSPSSGSPAAATAEFFCMIDTSRVEEQDRGRAQLGSIRQAVESEVRTKEGQTTWRLSADEIELQRVKEAAQKTAVTGARVMRDQLYPVKVDNVNRTAILDRECNVLQGASEALGAENNVTICKITWLSNKETSKAYGSMVVYVTKKNDAKKLLDGKYFDLAGESACAANLRSVEGVRARVIITGSVMRWNRNASCAADRTNRSAGTVVCGTSTPMHKTLSILQLNVQKREPVQQSLMNDEDLKDYGVLAVSEPYARMIDGKVVTSPLVHKNWTRIVPTHTTNALYPIRSMLWVRDDIEMEQIPVPSADLAAAVLQLPERDVVVVSVYVKGKSIEALKTTTGLLHGLIQRFRQSSGARADVVLAGDFNRHDLLWGGDEVSIQRQGEAAPIIELMNEHGLQSLLPRGTKTWQCNDQESTIDLVLATSELADEMVACTTHPTDHGSDHRAIQTRFDVSTPERIATPRLLFKNAPWNLIRARVKDNLRSLPWAIDVQPQTDQLMRVVTEAIYVLTPRARPPPYAKRWWTKDLTQLRRAHTFWRNQARSQRRTGQARPDLERRAKEAAKEYHDAIRSQRKAHWDEFLLYDANIWKAAKYLKAGEGTLGDKVPHLKKRDGSTTRNKAEQVDELLDAFFPPLPNGIEDEGVRPQRKAIPMPGLTLGEIEEKVMAAKPWKASGEDGLPAAVWKQLWPVVKERVLALFGASVRDGKVPRQWRTAKIIPLKKPERTTRAWRNRKVLSLISFDVKGAYNGVCKERLLDRMRARGISAELIRWVDAFCSARTASMVVNGHTSEQRELPQAGLPQGSPLSPILFLFFNADLVQKRIKAESGSIAFVDDYSAWVTGPTAESNRAGIQSIIDDALEWEARSGATFEADKTTVIHFTRATWRKSDMPFLIKGERVKPRESAKILGVIIDVGLRYQEHMAKAAAAGLNAAMFLRRLKMLSPRVARHLFEATVVPAMDYASSVWTHALRAKQVAWMNKAQMIGAQAITGAFRTVATAVAEAEASIRTVEERHSQATMKLCISLQTPPSTHPLAALRNSRSKRFISPMRKIVSAAEDQTGRMEIIHEYALPPWTSRIPAVVEDDATKAVGAANEVQGIMITTSSSQKNGMVGMGGVVCGLDRGCPGDRLASFSVTVGPADEQNPYTAELAAIATALTCIPGSFHPGGVTVVTSNRSALEVIRRPRKQSGQCTVRQIYDRTKRLLECGSSVKLLWAPARHAGFKWEAAAKAAAQKATQAGCVVEEPSYRSTSTALRLELSQRQRGHLPEGIGKHAKRIDKALPGRHTRALYDSLTREESDILVQLRTGGKAASDGDNWKPNVQAVRATIKFARRKGWTETSNHESTIEIEHATRLT